MRCTAVAKVGQEQRIAQCELEHGHDVGKAATAHNAEGFVWYADPVDEHGVTRAPWLKMFVSDTVRVLADMNDPDRAEALKRINEAFGLRARSAADVVAPFGTKFGDDLEKHRARIEQYLSVGGAQGDAMRAIWFLLAVAHQP